MYKCYYSTKLRKWGGGMNAIVAGKQEKVAGSMVWKSVLNIPVALNVNNAYLYSSEAYAYINSNIHCIRIDFVDETISIIPVNRLLIMSYVSYLTSQGCYLNLDGQRNFVFQGNVGLFISFVNGDGFQGILMSVNARNGDSGDTGLLQEKVKSIQIGYFE